MKQCKIYMIWALCAFLGHSCAGWTKPGTQLPKENRTSMKANLPQDLPELTINDSTFTELGDLHFKHSVGGAPIAEETLVQLKFDSEYLEIKFECRDNPRMDQNHFTRDNTTMYTQEVFELFISKGREAQEKYIEIQLNPNNAMFLAKIHNPYKEKGTRKMGTEFLVPGEEGVQHSVVKDRAMHTWSGHMKIPLRLLDHPKPIQEPVYRLNFYRIISNKDHLEEDWSNNAGNSTYACWSPTLSQTPNFHRPEYFGTLILAPKNN